MRHPRISSIDSAFYLLPEKSLHGRVLTFALLTHGSSDSRPIAWCVAGVFAGLYIFYRGFRLLQRRHLILDTPVSKIRSAPLGIVEINGLAAGPYTLPAPITQRLCYYYRTVAWEWKQRGKNKQWVKVAVECMHLPFFLDDNTGKVMVDPRGAELDLHRDFEQEFCDGFFTTKEEAPANVHDFLLRHGVSTLNKIKIEEFCIKPKNALFVMGTLDENPGLELTATPIQEMEPVANSGEALSLSLSGSSLSSSALGGSFGNGSLGGFVRRRGSEDERLMEAVLPISGSGGGTGTQDIGHGEVIRLSPVAAAAAPASQMTQQQKVAAALLRAGITNPAAWAAAGVASAPAVSRTDANGNLQTAAKAEDSSSMGAAAGFEQKPRVVLMKGKNNPTFLISWKSQQELARSLGLKCGLMIWGGPALTIFCLWALHNMTNWF